MRIAEATVGFLGLALVRPFAEIHRARVRSASEGEGLGATIIVTRPVHPFPTRAAVSAPLAAPTQAPKPVDTNDLAEMIARLVESRRSSKARRRAAP